MVPIDRALALAGVAAEPATSLISDLSISTIEELEEAARSHQLQSVQGLNISLEYHILRCVQELRSVEQGILIDVARFQAAEVETWLGQQEGVLQVETVGDLRRGRDLVRTVEVLAATHDASALLHAFAKSPIVKEPKKRGESRFDVMSVLDIPISLHTADPDCFNTALLKLTGSQAHLTRLKELAMNQGLKFDDLRDLKLISEKEIYDRLGLPYISPELREAHGEIEAALAGELPDLIAADQIQGDLHMHTSWADGLNSIGTMADAARSMGYRFIAICDHSPLIEEANGLDPVRLRAQGDEIERLKRRYSDFEVLKGLEVDIKADGTLDMPDEALRELDVVIASIHFPYDHDAVKVTKRLIAAMEHPLVDIIGHPTGRLIKQPDLYTVDEAELLKTAARTGTVLEINSGPDRLDLSDELAYQAGEYGVPLIIGSDAHSIEQLHWIHFGVTTARRAWLEGVDVLNTLPLTDLRQRLKRHRGLTYGV